MKLTLVLLLSILSAPVLAQEFKACVKTLRAASTAQGISAQVFDKAMAGVEPDPGVIDSMDNQPEFTTPIWDYLAGLVDDQRIADGKVRLAEFEAVLAAIEKKFGVDRQTLVALWGIETDYGRNTGKRPLVRSLATASCFGARQRYFRGEFIATLRILQAGDVKPELLAGSWSGAFGHTQFMPTTFQRLAVDFDGDGHRDIVGSVADALASSANYLRDAGWASGEAWGYEVRLPKRYSGPSGRRAKRALAQWSKAGIRKVDGTGLTGSGTAALLLPAGPEGPAFIVFRNFDALFSYNAAESYAFAIALLSDRLRGGGPIRTAWPTDDPGLSRAERRDIQRLLAERGYDIGEPDGIIGQRTREAIKSFQASVGLPVDGHAGTKVLNALKTVQRQRNP
jgi:lytic murein transglycosylase